jgi:hypothetical protein
MPSRAAPTKANLLISFSGPGRYRIERGLALLNRLLETPTASTARRRSRAVSGRLPQRLACKFTLAERVVLGVVAVEVERSGASTLTLEHTTALAGVCRTIVGLSELY